MVAKTAKKSAKPGKAAHKAKIRYPAKAAHKAAAVKKSTRHAKPEKRKPVAKPATKKPELKIAQIGRASCRERV